MGYEQKIAREQLDSWHVSRFPKARAALMKKPVHGWIRAIRFALGMSGRQLAERMGITRSSISAIEKREQDGSVTIQMMLRVAEAMDCTFFYGFLPNKSFDDIVRHQAEIVARERIDRINRTMMLEGQELPEEEAGKVWRREVENLVDQTPRTLWNMTIRQKRDR